MRTLAKDEGVICAQRCNVRMGGGTMTYAL